MKKTKRADLTSTDARQSDYRIAILQTDSVLPQFQPEHGNYPEMFVQLLSGAGLEPSNIETIDVQSATLPDPTAYQGYLITGSRHSVYDDAPWIAPLAQFVGSAMAAKRRVVGICFGHQLLAHFFGGHVALADNGWAVGVHENTLLSEHAWMQPSASTLCMLSSHQDQVQSLPEGAQLIASTPHCPIAGFVVGNTALALQSHPEFSPAYAAELMQHRAEILGTETLDEGLASLVCPLGNDVAAQWIVNFFLAA